MGLGEGLVGNMAGTSDRIDGFVVANVMRWLPQEPIASFRRAYDPTVDLLAPHLTLVFPIPASVGFDPLRDHVADVSSRAPAFDIRLQGLEKSWDHFLFLTVSEGRGDVIALHDALYTGILRPHLWTEHPYLPHVGLGFFADERDAGDLLDVRPRRLDRERFDRALREAEALDLNYVGRFDSLWVLGLDDGLTHVTPLEELPLA
jgi:2'-5' RNA ligase